jgi:site-specific recombinase XerD
METAIVQRTGGTFPELAQFSGALDVAPTTAEGYTKKVRDFLTWAGAHNVVEPKAADILAYKRELSARGLSAYSVSAYLSAVRRFFSWAESEGLYPNVAREVRGAKTRRGHNRDALTVSQVRDVLKGGDARETALLTLLFTTALRTIEVVRADVGDLRTVGEKTVLYVQGKGRETKDDFTVLPEQAVKALHAYLQTRDNLRDADPLFSGAGNRNRGRLTTRTVRRIVKASYLRAGINSPRITAHSTRHTAVTLSLLAGASLQETQALARHANIATTTVYAHNLDRLKAGTESKVAGAIFEG